MGKNSIEIRKIIDKKTRTITFNVRKRGLIRKTIELSMLCDKNVFLGIIDTESKSCTIYQSHDKNIKEFAQCIESSSFKMEYLNNEYYDKYEDIYYSKLKEKHNKTNKFTHQKRRSKLEKNEYEGKKNERVATTNDNEVGIPSVKDDSPAVVLELSLKEVKIASSDKISDQITIEKPKIQDSELLQSHSKSIDDNLSFVSNKPYQIIENELNRVTSQDQALNNLIEYLGKVENPDVSKDYLYQELLGQLLTGDLNLNPIFMLAGGHEFPKYK